MYQSNLQKRLPLTTIHKYTKLQEKLHKKQMTHHSTLQYSLPQVIQSSNMFSGYAQGLQCIPNTIVSLIYRINKNYELWKLKDIKNILCSGNILYKSIRKRTTLLVSNVPQYIKLYNFIYYINEQNSVIGDISKEDKEFNTVPFKKVEAIIVTHNSVC